MPKTGRAARPSFCNEGECCGRRFPCRPALLGFPLQYARQARACLRASRTLPLPPAYRHSRNSLPPSPFTSILPSVQCTVWRRRRLPWWTSIRSIKHTARLHCRFPFIEHGATPTLRLMARRHTQRKVAVDLMPLARRYFPIFERRQE